MLQVHQSREKLSLLLLHYWKETTDRGKKQSGWGKILEILERRKCVHLTPLTPGRRQTKLLISLCACFGSCGKREAFPEARPRALGWFPWCRAVLFGSLQGAVASFPLWVDPGTVSGTEVHQKPQQFDCDVSLFRSKPHSALTKTASRHPWCGFG